MKVILYILSLFVVNNLCGQEKPILYSNFGHSVSVKSGNFYPSKIHQIFLNPDSTFEFWSRPQINCLTWSHYSGTWKQNVDTLFFFDEHQVIEDCMKVTYLKDTSKYFTIKFKTDKNSELVNNKIKVKFIYDFNSHMCNFENEIEYKFDSTNTIKIPFNSILNLYLLASIRIDYQLNMKEKRWGYLSEDKTINTREGNIPNIINVEFVEVPKKGIVSRSTKGVIDNNKLAIISSFKTKTTLPDYQPDVEFQNFYELNK
jgi:hypothetical protein